MKKLHSIITAQLGLLILLASCSMNTGTESVTAESVGLNSDTLEVAVRKMQQYVDSGKLAGIATLVMKNGKLVHRELLQNDAEWRRARR